MNKLHITAITAAITLAFSAGAIAQTMSKAQYSAAKSGITADYKLAVGACDSFTANAKDVCRAEAKGHENVARAELEASYKPNQKSGYTVTLAKAQAVYAVAMEKCDDKAGNNKDVCREEAKAAKTSTNADAKASLKISSANQAANKTSAAAQVKAGETRAVARQDAATDKREAGYAVAREKCDKFADDAKAACVTEAKARFGQ